MRRRSMRLAAGGAVMLALASAASGRIDAAGEGARTIAFRHIHTNETLSIVYKKDGKYVADALEKINWIMRDWRKNQMIKIDPEVIDLLWEMHTELGSAEPIAIICGYRSNETNEMLRRTVGGQASQSQHISGKAIDVTFPDVPLKKIRYSALVRERGGVGYYPTSGIPFVHVDTASVRHWPRLPRYELALLFPNGHTKYQPADGGPITREDVRIAQSQHKALSVEIAQYLQDRAQPKAPVLVADAGRAAPQPQQGFVQASLGALPKAAPRETVVAALDPRPAPAAAPAAPPPQLVAQPKLVERSSRLTPGPVPMPAKEAPAKVAAAAPPPAAKIAAPAGPSSADRNKLQALVAAALAPPVAAEPKLVAAPRPATRPAAAATAAVPSVASAGVTLPAPPLPAPSTAKAPQVAALEPAANARGEAKSLLDSGWGTGWVPAPAFDEEHPEELSYRPFPVAPLLTASASADDPVLVRLEHPDVARTMDMIDDGGVIQPMSFRPGQQVAQVMWAQQFQGKAVSLPAALPETPPAAGKVLADRRVKTSSR